MRHNGSAIEQQQIVTSYLSDTHREMQHRRAREQQLEARLKMTTGVVEQLRTHVQSLRHTEDQLRQVQCWLTYESTCTTPLSAVVSCMCGLDLSFG